MTIPIGADLFSKHWMGRRPVRYRGQQGTDKRQVPTPVHGRGFYSALIPRLARADGTMILSQRQGCALVSPCLVKTEQQARRERWILAPQESHSFLRGFG